MSSTNKSFKSEGQLSNRRETDKSLLPTKRRDTDRSLFHKNESAFGYKNAFTNIYEDGMEPNEEDEENKNEYIWNNNGGTGDAV